jgi:phosphoglycolate phosphatase-like HAD superfamily hydrolase
MNLVLFDIDGTILHARNAGTGSFFAALEDVFGHHPEDPEIRFAGNTDLNILGEIMEHRGREWSQEEEEAFFTALPRKLKDSLAEVEPILYPGLLELLDALSRRADVMLGLVTGNIESCARVKLEAFGLSDYFKFGGFGDDHADRKEMARLAVERAGRRLPDGVRFQKCLLIGDTPSDVEAAQAIGACKVGVLTGGSSEEELLRAGAEHVFTDLRNPQVILDLLDTEPVPG